MIDINITNVTTISLTNAIAITITVDDDSIDDATGIVLADGSKGCIRKQHTQEQNVQET